MFIRFVVGLDDENHRSLTGLITEARLLRDKGSHDQLQVYRAVVCPGLVFANWRYARSPKTSPITTQAQ
jgi:hypothetical protein